ncbi:MAG: hypothetical protein VKJ44_10625 [Synechococcus sp.]|nr:hypothetical protein [Synechococcus sp.]
MPPRREPGAAGRDRRRIAASPAGPVTGSAEALATNVVRVPFGLRRPRRQRPQRAATWATLVIPFQLGNDGPPPPPRAA